MESSQAPFIQICPSCSGLNRVKTGHAKAIKCGHCGNNIETTELKKSVTPVDMATLQHVVKNSPVPVLVDFWAPWCGPCVAFAPTYEEYSEKKKGTVLCLKLNTEDHEQAGAAFNIRGIPTLAMFKDGRETARQAGAMNLQMLGQWVESKI